MKLTFVDLSSISMTPFNLGFFETLSSVIGLMHSLKEVKYDSQKQDLNIHF